MTKKIVYYLPEWKVLPDFCPECGQDLEDGEKYYYHGQGVFTCSKECAEDYE